MRGFTLNKVCQCGFITFLLLFSFVSLNAAVSFDLTELRNKVAKIKVNPRGNLWATGHFMGKKSVMDGPLLPSAEGQGVDAEEQGAIGELFQEFLREALQAQVDTEESRSKKSRGGLVDEDFRKLHPQQKVTENGAYEHRTEVSWPSGFK